MTIDTKRLKTDAAYWDEVAPLGATHHWSPSGDWYQDCGDHVLAWNFTERNWQTSEAPLRITRDEATPRPTKPAVPEWDGEGLPPVGCESELKRGDEWVPVKITGRGERVTVFRKLESFMEHITEAEAHEFRPIRTAEQRQREELVDLMEAERENYSPKAVTAEQVADAILSRYNLEPKP